MKILSNGITKEVKLIKHFKVLNNEYVIYQYEDTTAVGLIEQNKIIMPSGEKVEEMKKVIGNLINSNIGDCTILGNIEDILEEVSIQRIKLSDNQLNIIIRTGSVDNNSTTNTPNTTSTTENTSITENTSNKPAKRNSKLIFIIGIIVILLIIVIGFIFIPKKKSTPKKESNTKTTFNELVEYKGGKNKSNVKLNIFEYEQSDTPGYKYLGCTTKNSLKEEYGYDSANYIVGEEVLGTYQCYNDSCTGCKSSYAAKMVIINDKNVLIYNYQNNKAYDTGISVQNKKGDNADVHIVENKNHELKGVIVNFDGHASYFKYSNGKYITLIDKIEGSFKEDAGFAYDDKLILENKKINTLYDANTGKKIEGSDIKYQYGSLSGNNIKYVINNYKYDLLDDNYKRIFNNFYDILYATTSNVYVYNKNSKEVQVYNNKTKKASSLKINYPIITLFGNNSNSYMLLNKNNTMVLFDMNNKELKELGPYNKNEFHPHNCAYYTQKEIEDLAKTNKEYMGKTEGIFVNVQKNGNESCYYYYNVKTDELEKNGSCN